MMAPNSSATRAELRQRSEIAVHREHAVGDEQLALRRGKFLQDLARRVGVLVRKHFDRRAAQAAPVDDARVIELVGHDDVVFREHGGDGAGVGGEPALKHDDRFDVLERRQPALELHVHLHGAGDGAHRAGARAVLSHGFERRLAQLRVRRQSEIVVGREIDDRLVIERRVSLLLASRARAAGDKGPAA